MSWFLKHEEAMPGEHSMYLLKEGKYDQLYAYLREQFLEPDMPPNLELDENRALLYIDDNGIDALGDGELCFADWNLYPDRHYGHRGTQNGELLTQLVCLILAKILTLIDLDSLSETRKTVGRLVPEEMLGLIQYHVAGSSAIVNYKPFLYAEVDITGPANVLKNQIKVLHERIDFINPFFWDFLVFDVIPYTGRIVFEYENQNHNLAIGARTTVRRTSEIWLKTPGALKMMADYMAGSGYSYRNVKIRETPYDEVSEIRRQATC